MSAGMKKRSGFTLIELLVVIAIIALLLSILTPALNAVKERAKRILCSNRLKQYGIAIHHYNAANGDRMMKIVRRWAGKTYFPCYLSTKIVYPSIVKPDDNIQTDEWNAYRINPYLELIDKNYDDEVHGGGVSDLVTCPNCSGDFMQDWIRDVCWHWFGENEQYEPDAPAFMEIAYCYWAGIDQVFKNAPTQCSFTATRYLTMDVPSPKRLLMSEILWITGDSPSGMAYRYNHGKQGWSWNGDMIGAVGHNDVSPYPQATGRGQLFGDGHVSFKPIPLDENLPTGDDIFWEINDGMWNGRDSGWVGDEWDCSYF